MNLPIPVCMNVSHEKLKTGQHRYACSCGGVLITDPDNTSDACKRSIDAFHDKHLSRAYLAEVLIELHRQDSTISRYEKMSAYRARHILAACRSFREEKIAEHYLKAVGIASALSKMIQIRKATETWPELDRSIETLTEEIRSLHMSDFGIPLYWPGESAQQPPTETRVYGDI